MKKLLSLFILALLPLLASAEDYVEIDGIYYTLLDGFMGTDSNLAKIEANPNKYVGEITIPASVTAAT